MAAHRGIFVLAGTNGAGKSSIAGKVFTRNAGAYFNPDEVAKAIVRENPGMRIEEANGLAWQRGFRFLRASIEQGSRYAFETTLGGETITATLLDAARREIKIHMWYCALATPELHIARVAGRVRRGGHDVAERTIRERYDASRRNLVRLMPHLEVLRVYDNSDESKNPRPRLILEMRRRRIVNADLKTTPEWAKPIVAAAFALDPKFAARR
ncbi:MAG TPA: AAA family ATPase [Gammaproteobacteria bacterium]|nr:AAA family ATPase [Gammaproteobacteria bacterium]